MHTADGRVLEIADFLERLVMRAVDAGEVGADGFDAYFVHLLDSTVVGSHRALSGSWRSTGRHHEARSHA